MSSGRLARTKLGRPADRTARPIDPGQVNQPGSARGLAWLFWSSRLSCHAGVAIVRAAAEAAAPAPWAVRARSSGVLAWSYLGAAQLASGLRNWQAGRSGDAADGQSTRPPLRAREVPGRRDRETVKYGPGQRHGRSSQQS